ncbi:polysaccharide deacetylase family protein [Peribacillus asahii]|uniref:polysaccharide deacetylase family protein n=1 Tax=Peribacillus asahii TaxID=228899 RepID=UPI002079649B|nr:polysaccharide deacetylase family protein [Peribacillus asahii]USK70552.1 polysaccharide deacetylase family protein [Peribacillus asahii]
MQIVVIISCTLCLLFLFYSIIPTVIIRTCGWGITQKVKGENRIALTFDDGPNPEYTTQLLDLLKKYQVKASFFVVGSKVKSNSDLVKRMHQEGHTIGIHHFQHISSWLMPPFILRRQLYVTEQAIKECTNEKVAFYRPPWGHFNLFTLFLSKNYHIVMWSHIFGDWKVKNCQQTLLDELRLATERGSILLLHDCGETLGADQEAPRYMLEQLEVYLHESKEKGIRFMTLNEMKRIS